MAKILMIDDDPDVTDAGKMVLERHGHTVTVANNVESGAEAIQASPPDLLILDIMMENPDDGIVFARRLRKEGRRFPIIALSSIGKVTGRDYDKDDEYLPVDDFVNKPVYPAILVEKVARLLANVGKDA
ncbi:Transcriptional regulatory protein AfsQ1 [Azospirillaceae bacterium]